MAVTRLTGDALETISTLPDQSIDLVACSPPFLELRDYNELPGQWGAIGIDLDPSNADLYEARYAEVERDLFPGRPKVHPEQGALL